MTTSSADDPSTHCSFLRQSDLLQKSIDDLQAMSFHPFPTNYIFRTIAFGESPYGVHGSTAIDVIHGILLGILRYLHSTFIDHLTGSQYKKLSDVVAFIATYASKKVPGFPEFRHFKKGLDRKGIITAKMILARCFLVYLALCTTTFREYLNDQKGKLPSAISKKRKANDITDNAVSHAIDDDRHDISNETCEDATDHLLDAVYSDSNDDSTYNPHDDFESMEPIVFTNVLYDQWKQLFENTLLLYTFLTQDKMPCSAFKWGSMSMIRYCFDNYKQQYYNVAYRYDGMGLKLTKFHQLRHWYFYIAMYGVPNTFDSAFCESHHIYLTKKQPEEHSRGKIFWHNRLLFVFMNSLSSVIV